MTPSGVGFLFSSCLQLLRMVSVLIVCLFPFYSVSLIFNDYDLINQTMEIIKIIFIMFSYTLPFGYFGFFSFRIN